MIVCKLLPHHLRHPYCKFFQIVPVLSCERVDVTTLHQTFIFLFLKIEIDLEIRDWRARKLQSPISRLIFINSLPIAGLAPSLSDGVATG